MDLNDIIALSFVVFLAGILAGLLISARFFVGSISDKEL
jgi:uncharacterized protein YneF (UPF0154 family)